MVTKAIGSPCKICSLSPRLAISEITRCYSEKWGNKIAKVVESAFNTDYARPREAVFAFVFWASRMGRAKVMRIVAIDVLKIRFRLPSPSLEAGGGTETT